VKLELSKIYDIRLEPNEVVSDTTTLVVDIIRRTLPSLSWVFVSRRMRWTD